MIYATKGAYFSSFLSSSKHKPTSEEVVGVLNNTRVKVRPSSFSDGGLLSRETGIPRAAPRPEPRADGRDAEIHVRFDRAATPELFPDGRSRPQVSAMGPGRYKLGRAPGGRARPHGGRFAGVDKLPIFTEISQLARARAGQT